MQYAVLMLENQAVQETPQASAERGLAPCLVAIADFDSIIAREILAFS
jgi:hypothetical protein